MASSFRKTVCLQDWWLIKAEKDVEGRRLAVAGLTSREQQAVRVFFSAPIVKRYDLFTLETADGIFVIIKGFINQVHTKENGFPHEFAHAVMLQVFPCLFNIGQFWIIIDPRHIHQYKVLDHFLFGFPPYWEEYAEKCLEEGSITKAVSRSNFDHNKLSTHSDPNNEETPSKNKKATSAERSDTSDRMEGLEDCGNIVLAKGQHSLKDNICNGSSVKVLRACSSQVVSQMIAGDALKGVSNVGIKSTGQIYSSTSESQGHPTVTEGPVNDDVNETMENPSLSKDSGKNNSKLSQVDIRVPWESSGQHVARSCKRMDTSKIDGKGNKRTRGLSKGKESRNLNILTDIAKIDVSLQSLLPEIDNASPSKFNDPVYVETSVANLYLSSKRSDSSESSKADECKKDRLKNGNGLENERNKSASVCASDSDTVTNVANGSEGRSVLYTSDAGLQEPVSGIINLDTGYVKHGSDKNYGFSPSETGPEGEQDMVDVMIQVDTENKKTNETIRWLGDANHKDDLKITGGKKVSNAKLASSSRKKTKRELTYESPTTQGGKERTFANSSGSLSFKRSRSGRLLLPTLEFWRNQMAIYDAQRCITGIQDGLHPIEPSRGSRSEPQRKRKQLR